MLVVDVTILRGTERTRARGAVVPKSDWNNQMNRVWPEWRTHGEKSK